VALNGAIDFMCFPRFDSPSIFAALLDPEKGGHFQICPELNHARRKQLYLPDTNILLTRFLSVAGMAEISDSRSEHMFAKVYSGAVYGVEAFEVEIEVDAGGRESSHRGGGAAGYGGEGIEGPRDHGDPKLRLLLAAPGAPRSISRRPM
jgi:Domain of unknown function (DUF5911)